MLWFNKERKRKMEYLKNYVPTSKAQLIQASMYYGNGDLKKAQEMFDFYARNLDLPDFDPVAPTFIQQMKDGASSLFGFIKENQGDIVQGYQIIQSIIKNKGALIIPEISEKTAQSINE